jgi:transposase
MWTPENRARYDRSKLCYRSDLTDQEWALIEPLIPPAKRGGNRRTVVVRDVGDGLMYILSTSCQWSALPRDVVRVHRPQTSRRSSRGLLCRVGRVVGRDNDLHCR